MKSVFILSVVVFLAIIIGGCGNAASNSANVRTDADIKIAVDYHNGVYYFSTKEADFPNALSSFIQTHKELELIAMTGDATGDYGKDVGYFVVFRPKR